MYDLIIKNGTVVDPAQGLHARRDLAVQDGKITALLEPGGSVRTRQEVDAHGLLVTPGLIDMHVHIFSSFSHYGVDVDPSCLAKGVTTVLDAGSAGSQTFPAFERYVAAPSQTRVFALLNISSKGLITGAETEPAIGELEYLPFCNVSAALRCIEANRSLILGVKIRLSDDLAAGGRNEARALALAREVADTAQLPLMVHYAFSAVPLEELLPSLRAGDILTHCYHAHRSGILDNKRRVHPLVLDAIQRGVLLDVGHGRGAFSFDIARTAIRQNVWPHTISSDLHSYNIYGPVFDLVTTASKMLHLGMSLVETVRAVTETPAKALGQTGQIGSLRPGAEADIALLELAEGRFELVDATGEIEIAERKLISRHVFRAGKPYVGVTGQHFDNHPPWYRASTLEHFRLFQEQKYGTKSKKG